MTVDTCVSLKLVCFNVSARSNDAPLIANGTAFPWTTAHFGINLSKEVPLLFKILFLHLLYFSAYIFRLIFQPQQMFFDHASMESTARQLTKRFSASDSIWCYTLGKPHMCYHLPGNESVEGSSFGADVFNYLKPLGLLNQRDRYIVPSYFLRNHSPVFLTAANSVYYRPSLMAIRSLQEHFPFQKIIFYDLGLSRAQASHIDRLCNVERVVFPFGEYPDYVRNLKEYRWKPIIIAKTLVDHGALWYLDSSVTFRTSNLSFVYRLLHPPPGQKGKIEQKFSIILHASTGHGIYSATSPEVYKYIPADFEKLKSASAMMYQAGLLLAFRTKEAVENIMLWYVACALEKGCMGPEDANSFCQFRDKERLMYADCHRYDQSVLNLLLANRLNYDHEQWTSGIDSFCRIERHQVNDTHPPFEC
uniref:Nucleotide-diphospho-sugar transferase domain-containing protein n=1 Tax=Trichuris muris TaxID=70415 RepID=A0A5S6QQD4_TRIMR